MIYPSRPSSGCLSILLATALLAGCAGDSGPQKVWGQYETYSCEDLAAERDRLDALALSYKEGEAREEYIREENTWLSILGRITGLKKSPGLKERIAGAEARSALMVKHMKDKQCPMAEGEKQ